MQRMQRSTPPIRYARRWRTIAAALTAASALMCDGRPAACQSSSPASSSLAPSAPRRPATSPKQTKARPRRRGLDTALFWLGVANFSAWTLYGVTSAIKKDPEPVGTFFGTTAGILFTFSAIVSD